MAWGNPEAMALEQEFCDEFNRRNPDIHVTFFRVPQSAYLNKAILMLASRTAPDVIRIDHYNFPSLVRKDYFLDMTELAKKDPTFDPKAYFPLTIREGMYKGRLHGMNVMFGGEIVYYNKTLIREAGLEDPYELWKRGEWTYDRFRRHAIAMTKFDKNGKPLRFGCAIPTFPMSVPIIWAFGGDLLTPDWTRSTVGSDGTIRAYQYLADLRWKDRCAPTPAQSANAQFNFESGKLGMEINWSGSAPRLRKVVKDFEWDICPMPKGPYGGTTMVKGNQLVISKETRHPEASWRFIRFMTGPVVETKLYAEIKRNFPTLRSVAYSKTFLEDPLPPSNKRAYIQAVENARELPITARWGEWTTAFNAEQDNLFSGRERDAAKAMKRAESKINEILADEEGF